MSPPLQQRFGTFRRHGGQSFAATLIFFFVTIVLGPCLKQGGAAQASLPFNDCAVQRTMPNFFTQKAAHNVEERARYSSAVAVFQHVHKSGGIMVRRFLEAVSPHIHPEPALLAGLRPGESGRGIIAGFTAPSRLRAMLQSGHISPRSRQIIHGDHAFHFCDYLADSPTGVGCAYWIMMRDPVERMVSDYKYCVKPQHNWTERLERWRLGRGDFLCTATGLIHFNNSEHAPSLSAWAKARGNHLFSQLILTDDAVRGASEETTTMRRVQGAMTGIEWQRREASKDVPTPGAGGGHQAGQRNFPYSEEVAHWVADQLELWFAVVGLTSNMEESLRMASYVFNWTDAIELSGHDLAKPVHTSQRTKPGILTSKTASVHSSTTTNLRSARAKELGISIPEFDDIVQAVALDQIIFDRAKEIYSRQREQWLSKENGSAREKGDALEEMHSDL